MRLQCTCPTCGTPFTTWPSQSDRRFCCRPCSLRGRRRRDLRDRFWSKVDKNGPIPVHRPELEACWLWTASVGFGGRGKFLYDGRLRGAHVVAYILTVGHEPRPEAPFILHACDNGHGGCVRPSHLFPGTQQDNMTDMTLKGRGCIGFGRAAAKLDYALADEIRARYAGGVVSQTRLAAAYGVSATAIHQVLHTKTWVRRST